MQVENQIVLFVNVNWIEIRQKSNFSVTDKAEAALNEQEFLYINFCCHVDVSSHCSMGT